MKNNGDRRTALQHGEIIFLCRDGREEQYKIKKERGRGASSIVYQASREEDGYTYNYILKEFYPIKFSDSIERCGTELKFLENENAIVDYKKKFIGALDIQTSLALEEGLTNSTINGFLLKGNNTQYIGMQFNEGTDFLQFLENGTVDNPFFLQSVLKTLLALVKVIERCHQKGYMLFDVKPENVFVIPETPELIKLFDYDSLHVWDEIYDEREKISFSGEWSAPEIRNGQLGRITEATDYYAIGSMLYYAIFQKCPSIKECNIRAKEWLLEDVKTFDPYCYDGSLLKKLEKFTRILLRRKEHNAAVIMDNLEKLIYYASPYNPHIVNQKFIQNNTDRYKYELIELRKKIDKNTLLLVEGLKYSGKSEFIKIAIEELQNVYDVVQYIDCKKYTSIADAINEGLITVPDFFDKDIDKNIWRKMQLIKESESKTLIVFDNLNLQNIDCIELLQQILLECKGRCVLIFVTNRCHRNVPFDKMRLDSFSPAECIRNVLSSVPEMEWDVSADINSIGEIMSLSEGYLPLAKIIANMAKVEKNYNDIDNLHRRIDLETIRNSNRQISSPYVEWAEVIGEWNTPIQYVRYLWQTMGVDDQMEELLMFLYEINYPIPKDVLVSVYENQSETVKILDELLSKFLLEEENHEIHMPRYIRNILYCIKSDNTDFNMARRRLIDIITSKVDIKNNELLYKIIQFHLDDAEMLGAVVDYFVNSGNCKGLTYVEKRIKGLSKKTDLILFLEGKIKYYQCDCVGAYDVLNKLRVDNLEMKRQWETLVILAEIEWGRNEKEKWFLNKLKESLLFEQEFLTKVSEKVGQKRETYSKTLFQKICGTISKLDYVGKTTPFEFIRNIMWGERWKPFNHPRREFETIELASMLLQESANNYSKDNVEKAVYQCLESLYRLHSCETIRGKNLRVATLNILAQVNGSEASRVKDVISKQKEELLYEYRHDDKIGFHMFLSDNFANNGIEENVGSITEEYINSFSKTIAMIAEARGWFRSCEEREKIVCAIQVASAYLIENISQPSLLDFRKLIYSMNSCTDESVFNVIMYDYGIENPSLKVKLGFSIFNNYYNRYREKSDEYVAMVVPIVLSSLDILQGRDNVIRDLRRTKSNDVVEIVKNMEPMLHNICRRDEL